MAYRSEAGQPWNPRHPKAEAMAATAYANASGAWCRKQRWWAAGVIAVIFASAGCAAGGGSDDPPVAGDEQSTKRDNGDEPSAEDDVGEPEDEAQPEMTSGQRNALKAAEKSLDRMSLSKQGLIRQLSSTAGDDYSKADATFAANNVKADWHAEAVEAAKAHLDIRPTMSHHALEKQLWSSAGDQFTEQEAKYAAHEVWGMDND